MIGQSLGHYQILEKLGSGGMGEVYKARDTRLNRLVAIKVLTPDKVADPARKRRFIQEAQAASALNHPNIVIIYDINNEKGVDFMVMEYVEGKTLDALIPRQGMRLAELLKIAIPIADGFAKAHAAGIIHRDIKPANLMVATDGRAKILDFGLAKLTEIPEPSPEDATRTNRPETEDGAILGTIAYMSPEQAEAKRLDQRSDIFSFGAVLYEMVTGRRAFQGDSRMATLSAILRDEPRQPENIPGDLDKILRRCLRKDINRRFQHMDDLRVALEELREESESGRLTAQPVAPKRSFMPWLAVPAVILAAAGGIWWQQHRTTPKDPGLKLRQLTADSGFTGTPAISPDGRFVAYASDRGTNGNLDIWVQPLTAGATPIRLTTDPADDDSPAFSNDGGMIAFHSNRNGGGIYLIPALGGTERLLTSGGNNPRFSPDGNSIAYWTGIKHNLWLTDATAFVIPVAGGAPRRIASDLGWSALPVWSPSGKEILLWGAAGPNRPRFLWVVPAEGGRAVQTDLGAAVPKSPGFWGEFDWQGEDVLAASGTNVWSVPFNGTARKGEFQSLISGAAQLSGVRGSPRRLVLESGGEASHLWKFPVDLNSGRVTGPPLALPHSGGSQIEPSMSTDGKFLAYKEISPSGTKILSRDTAAGRETTLIAAQDVRAKISPDGTWVAHSPYRSGRLFLMSASGGQSTGLLEDPGPLMVYGWSADSNRIVYWHGSPVRFSLFDRRTRKSDVLIAHPTYNIHGAALSPDMKWVAFHIPQSGKEPLSIAPVREQKAAGEGEWIKVADYPGRNATPWWSFDGNRLYFVSGRDGHDCLWTQQLKPDTKQPVGEATAIAHFHDPRRRLHTGNRSPALTKDEIILPITESTSNVWMAESPETR